MIPLIRSRQSRAKLHPKRLSKAIRPAGGVKLAQIYDIRTAISAARIAVRMRHCGLPGILAPLNEANPQVRQMQNSQRHTNDRKALQGWHNLHGVVSNLRRGKLLKMPGEDSAQGEAQESQATPQGRLPHPLPERKRQFAVLASKQDAHERRLVPGHLRELLPSVGKANWQEEARPSFTHGFTHALCPSLAT